VKKLPRIAASISLPPQNRAIFFGMAAKVLVPLAVATVAAFSRSACLHGAFVYDDDFVAKENAVVSLAAG
jgi:hypothetical protein